MAELYGWVGKILKVDLTTGTITTVPTSNYVPKWIGGRGIGAKIHWDMVAPDVKAFDPENVITFMTGPLVGTAAPTAGKISVQAVSPIGYPTEHYLRSIMGGHWGPELKFAGYDGIIVKGKAAKPVYLLIQDGDVEIRDAGTIWGLDTYATQQNLWERHSEKTRVATIGPAGEHLCREAIILTDDGSCCGLGGFGAVMGSKNLKAIAVRGTGGIPVSKPEEFLEFCYYVQRMTTRKEGEAEFPNSWRGCIYDAIPTINTPLREEAEKGTARVGFMGCFGCPIGCGASVKLMDGSEVGGGALKCTQLYAAGEPFFGRDHLARLKLLDLLGISNLGFWVSTFSALRSAKLLTQENTGISMDEWGSVEFSREVIYKTAYREGIFDKVADGMARFCCEYLKTPQAIALYQSRSQVSGRHGGSMMGNNLCRPPRKAANYGIPGSINAVTSNVSGMDSRNLYSETYWPDYYLHPQVIDPKSDEALEIILRASKKWYGSEQVVQDMIDFKWTSNMPYLTIWHQNHRNMADSLTACFIGYPKPYSLYTPDHMGDLSIGRQLYSTATGIDMTEEDETEFGSRLYMLERAILTRQGRARADDWFHDINFKDYDVRKELSEALDQFYASRGMDVATGLPRRSTLEALGLKDVADDLKTKYGVTVPA